jgi:hypothetical protein
LKSGHVLSDRLDPAGQVGAGNRNLRGAEPKSEDPHEVRLAGHEMPGSAIDPGGDDADKHILLADAGRCDVADLQHVGRPVGVLHDRLHDHHLAISSSHRPHAAGRPVTAHAHGTAAVAQAIAVGVDGIEHCSCVSDRSVGQVSDETLAALLRSQITVVPPPSAWTRV